MLEITFINDIIFLITKKTKQDSCLRDYLVGTYMKDTMVPNVYLIYSINKTELVETCNILFYLINLKNIFLCT